MNNQIRRLLIVEDDEDLRTILVDIVGYYVPRSEIGFICLSASSVDDALQKFADEDQRTGSQARWMVWSDGRMPDQGDGPRLLKQLRLAYGTRIETMLLMTANDLTPDERSTLVDAGGRYVRKPVGMEQLAPYLKNFLGR